MKRISVKYLAGLVDGEGCIDWSFNFDKKYNAKYMRPRLRINLAEPGFDVIDLLYNNFGGHIETRKSNNDNWSDSKTWYVVGSRAVSVLNNIKAGLIIKKEQAKLGIAWEKHLKGLRLNPETIDVANANMKLMKKDPHRLSEKAVKEILQTLD